ncbi:sodium:solute symporter family protein [[Clostridium] symbiosum]|uniref:sodium:solute symporter family protein n=1 Tax=Clostridium symbiosum TaxID=1512 RepID=UPI001D0936D8|nr:sodium:solute symporter family protein [[Clostridium] symbiosum]MCB6610613.1 sodium:solute symporter family protein [[Clostridium] symbiosum]MCB6930941.1 sodium:solute symporter family protein [[Clostridium] symbiosum]
MQIIIVLGCYLLLMLGIGIYGKRYASNFSEYLTASKQSTIIMIIGTGIGAHIGSGFVIGGAESAVTSGFGGVWYGVGCALSYLLFATTVARLIHRKGYVTLSDYYLERYKDKGTRLIYSVSTAFAYLGILGAQIMAGKAIFEGFGYSGTIGAVITTVVVLIYASMSGLWGAYMTSVIQTLIIGIGLIAATAFILLKGGWGIITSTLPASQFELIPFDVSTWLMLFVPVALANFTDQGNFQRASSAKTDAIAVKGHLLAGLLILPLACMPVVIGMYGAAAFPDAPASSIFFKVVLAEFPPILGAILIASVLSAVMSTADMSFLAISATVVHDIYAGMIKKDAKEAELKKMANILNIVVCAVALMMALMFTNIISLLSLTYSFMVAGCMVPFLGGLLWKRGNAKGAIASAIVGIGLTLLDASKILPLPYASVLPVLPAAIAYVLVSLCTKETYKAEEA